MIVGRLSSRGDGSRWRRISRTRVDVSVKGDVRLRGDVSWRGDVRCGGVMMCCITLDRAV